MGMLKVLMGIWWDYKNETVKYSRVKAVFGNRHPGPERSSQLGEID